MTNQIKYTIIVPVFNGAEYLEECINSILNQKDTSFGAYEIIIIDDCSTDSTLSIMNSFKTKKVKLFQTKTNSGPGNARNIGLENASGDWILFLDSDDTLKKDAFFNLSNFISLHENCDMIAYNWEYNENSSIKSDRSGRYDINSFNHSKEQLINNYLSWGMDGSVIYTLISHEIIKENNLKFRNGFHEDVDFIFKVYYYSKNPSVMDKRIYLKNNRKDSIVNKISKKHINGFFNAYEEIYIFLKNENFLDYDVKKFIYIGIVGITTTRIREIWVNGKEKNQLELYILLSTKVKNYLDQYLKGILFPNLKTKYFIIYSFFIQLVEKNQTESINGHISKFLQNNFDKSWSCDDLHNSLFLGPNEIRTCCKRFFVKNQIKGDVVLLKDNFSVDNILKAKNRILSEINQGISEDCNSCPFLEFKEWGRIQNVEIKHLSFEYHSICNMKCIYCSEKYYGNKEVSYNIKDLLDNLIDNLSFNDCKSIVWGGGEPTLEKNFIPLLTKLVNYSNNIDHRIITNSTVYVQEIYEYLNNDRIKITTSIDAGSEKVFDSVRKSKKFFTVFDNLKKYSSHNPTNVTIKYILLDENNSIEELKSFVNLIKAYKLDKCNFQISFNFKTKYIDIESIVMGIVLYGLLSDISASFIYFDDLFLQRLNLDKEEKLNQINCKLNFFNYRKILFDYKIHTEIVIWGAGNSTKHLLSNSYMLKNIKILYIVDDNRSKIDTRILDYDIKDPSTLKLTDVKIYISAFENYEKIYQNFLNLDINTDRLIKGVFL